MADDRESLGRIAHETWGNWWRKESEQAGSVPLWEELGREREMYMRVASAVAALAVKDARLDVDRMLVRLFALGAHMPAIIGALRLAEAGAEYEARAKPYRAALTALGAEEGKTP